MNEIDLLREYGARTQASQPVHVDVTARVLRTIRARREHRLPASVRPLVGVLAASSCAVLLTGFFVQQAWAELQDPVTSLLTPFMVALR